uniref:Uncharacterized protein n=1 Tax=Setaria italica TaxID=4555 RepID=K3XU44_SETIT
MIIYWLNAIRGSVVALWHLRLIDTIKTFLEEIHTVFLLVFFIR